MSEPAASSGSDQSAADFQRALHELHGLIEIELNVGEEMVLEARQSADQ
jgi:hypothetical protein